MLIKQTKKNPEIFSYIKVAIYLALAIAVITTLLLLLADILNLNTVVMSSDKPELIMMNILLFCTGVVAFIKLVDMIVKTS